MNADTTFMIGATHAICQDYSLASNLSHASYLVLSDGCSTSPDTDIGARLLVRATAQAKLIQAEEDISALHQSASSQALQWAQCIGLQPQSVDATLLTLYCDGEDLVVGASGDGVIILQSHSGSRDVYSISFPSGFPLYPSYAHQPERLEAWRSNKRSYKELEHFRGDSTFDLVETATSSELTEVFRVKANDYEYAMLLSDGLHSFYKTEESKTSRQLNSIPMDQVIDEIMSFKGGMGTFVARRAKKFARSCAAKGWQHADDLALGAIYLGARAASPATVNLNSNY